MDVNYYPIHNMNSYSLSIIITQLLTSANVHHGTIVWSVHFKVHLKTTINKQNILDKLLTIYFIYGNKELNTVWSNLFVIGLAVIR